jgi:hypothetical protein
VVGFGVVAQAEVVADEEQHQAVFCCCLWAASRFPDSWLVAILRCGLPI